MKVIEKVKDKARKLKKDISALYYAYQNPKTPVFPKVLVLLTLGYSLSPIDLIPDFIPVLGYLDDLIIIPLLIALSIKLIPDEIMEESREKALHEPLTLRKNWFVAVLFILVWIGILTAVISAIIRAIRK